MKMNIFKSWETKLKITKIDSNFLAKPLTGYATIKNVFAGLFLAKMINDQLDQGDFSEIIFIEIFILRGELSHRTR